MNSDAATGAIPNVQECRYLVNLLDDRDLCLTWKLGFHYLLQAIEIKSLVPGAFLWRDGLPHSISIEHGVNGRSGWHIPIRDGDGQLFAVLIPENGPLFQTDQPVMRLQQFARVHHCPFTAKLMHDTSLTYSLASGLHEKHAAEFVGVRAPERLRRIVISDRLRAEAPDYWALGPDLQKVSQMRCYVPRRRHASYGEDQQPTSCISCSSKELRLGSTAKP
jgi:hypothetical protein